MKWSEQNQYAHSLATICSALYRIKLMHLYSHELKHSNSIRLPVTVPVNHFLYITQINQSLGTSNTRKMCNKNKLFGLSRGITVDHGILLGVQATAITGLFPVTGVIQTGGIAVVPNCEYFSVIRGGDDRADPQPRTGGAPGDGFGKLHVHLFKGRTIFHFPSLSFVAMNSN
jgi:hypothetical protein